jgi:glycosyltransferase involved in cell wall biosynthesis
VSVGAERRLITIGHSYVVAENRRLAHEMAIAGRGRWRVTAVAPTAYRGDLRRIALEPIANEACAVVPLCVRFNRVPHLMWYAGLSDAFSAGADIVHCWEEPYVLAASQVARHAPPSALLVYATFQNLAKSYPPPLAGFERDSLSRAAGWIAFGRTVEETLGMRDGYGRIPHRVIPPGVDVARFAPDAASGRAVRRQIGWPEDALVVGYLGRFTPEKGLQDLCAALDRLTSPWHALFVGGGALQDELERLRDRHPGRVHVANGVDHADVPRWLNAMTVLSAPSRTTASWREQFGRMLIEAMSCGVPVVATTSGEMPNVVGDAARLVAEQDPAALAAALDALLGDPSAREHLSAAGVARARERFAWPVVARQHLDFFDALVDSHASR